MKKLFILSLLALFFVSVNAQKRNAAVDADTAQGNTVTFEPNYSVSYTGVVYYSGIVGFQFTKADIADSCSSIKLQGSYDGTNYEDVAASTAYLTNTSTDGTFFLYDATPEYLKYRLSATAATGDTTAFSNVRYIHKEED